MAIDSRPKRMAAIAPGCAWRGPLVDAAEAGFGAGARQAAAFYYGGIAAAAPPSALNQTRMSAMLLACPWRGPLVNPADAGFTQGNRQAAAFMYSAILAGAGGGPPASLFRPDYFTSPHDWFDVV